jgi:hypothetical protein
MVTVASRLKYFDGKLNFLHRKLRMTIPICKNHEKQITKSFAFYTASYHKHLNNSYSDERQAIPLINSICIVQDLIIHNKSNGLICNYKYFAKRFF